VPENRNYGWPANTLQRLGLLTKQVTSPFFRRRSFSGKSLLVQKVDFGKFTIATVSKLPSEASTLKKNTDSQERMPEL